MLELNLGLSLTIIQMPLINKITLQVGEWLKDTDTDADGKLSFTEFTKAVMDLKENTN